jgi:tetratricopeptide (TPR) repeat protein
MKSFLFIFLMSISFYQGQSQSLSNDCHKASAFLDELSYKYYWGTPEWIALMDSAITMCPTSAKAWGNKAMIYLMRGDVATWSTLIQKAVDNDPLYYLGNRAWHRLRYLRDYEGALHDLQRQDSIAGFHSIYVSDVHSYMLMGQCMEGMENMNNALSFYNTAIEKQNKERGENWVGTNDYLTRGIVKYKVNDWEGALKDFEK